MKIHELPKDPGRQQKRKRLGRGKGTGQGKTAGKGHKGHQARAGSPKGRATGFEGGQTPLHRRLPKRGFKNPFRLEFEVVNLSDLERAFEAGAKIGPLEFAAARLSRTGKLIKVLGNGELKKKLHVEAHAFSASAKAKIEAVGGTAKALVTVEEAPEA